jgi:hypothetical protein
MIKKFEFVTILEGKILHSGNAWNCADKIESEPVLEPIRKRIEDIVDIGIYSIDSIKIFEDDTEIILSREVYNTMETSSIQTEKVKITGDDHYKLYWLAEYYNACK